MVSSHQTQVVAHSKAYCEPSFADGTVWYWDSNQLNTLILSMSWSWKMSYPFVKSKVSLYWS